MHCSACGEANPAGNRFCNVCGLYLEAACQSCGHLNPVSAVHCGGCGTKLGPPRHVLPKDRSRRVRRVEGELKHVTVLFADLVSSTELVAGLDAEGAMLRLRPALDAMCLAVQRNRGKVVRTLGDGILALFGAPHALERHALLACHAALAMREALVADSATLAIRVGLHSGEAVIDAPYADPMIEPAAYGVVLHLGSRLPAMVQPGDICLSDETYRLVRSHCDVVSLGPHRLRGLPDEMELFQLTGLKPAVASQQFRAAELTSFHGREAEMATLQRALLAAERGNGQIVGVVGAPGTGKSRLCFEFSEGCRARHIPVAEARAQPYGTATPWQAVIEFLRSSWLRIAPDEDEASIRSRIAERLATLGPGFEADLPVVADFLRVRQSDSLTAWLDARMRIKRLLAVFREILRQRGTELSVIVFEDLHYLDDASEEFLIVLAETVAETRTLLLVTYRPNFAPPWLPASHYRQINLAELPQDDTRTMVLELMGARPELDATRRALAERSGGNPFFAEELIRSLVDRAVLVGPRGDYQCGPMQNTQGLPATLQAVIGSRIDMLETAERELLQIAAIIGKEFPVAILQRLAERTPEDLQASLDHLCVNGMLQAGSSFSGQSYGFSHPLIHEVAYWAQLRVVRIQRHAAVAGAMEKFYSDRLDEHAGLLSYHLETAGETERAARYAARAARWSGSTSPAQAIRHWHKVRTLLSELPRSPESDWLRIMASSQIVWLGWREGLTAEQARALIQEALAWAHDSDPSMIPLLLFVEGRLDGASGGQADEYVAVVRRALALEQPGRPTGRGAILGASLCQALGWAGLIREALAANDAALVCMPYVTERDNQFLGYGVEHWTLCLRGRTLIRLGRFDEAESCFERVLAIKGLTDPVVKQMTYLPYFELAWCLDDPAMAARYAWHAAANAAYQDSPYLQVYTAACSGIAAALDRDYPRAAEHFAEGLRRLRHARVAMEFEPELLAYLSEISLRHGAPDAAIAAGREAMAIAGQRHTRLADCRARITVARALLASGPRPGREKLQADAAALLDTAADLIRVTGIRIYDGLLLEARAWCALTVDGDGSAPHEKAKLA